MTPSTTKERPVSDPNRTDETPGEGGLIMGRPVEDRGFETVEASAGMVTGIAIGAVIAGPVGAVVGAAVGLAGGLAAGEAIERHEGRAARTTDATR